MNNEPLIAEHERENPPVAVRAPLPRVPGLPPVYPVSDHELLAATVSSTEPADSVERPGDHAESAERQSGFLRGATKTLGAIAKRFSQGRQELQATITENGNQDRTVPETEPVSIAERLLAGMLDKIGNQMGSNEGGWYEHQTTGEHFYMKFYKNPDQARIEYLANAIYAHAGVRSAQSQLVDVDGRTVIANREVPGAQRVYREELQDDPSILDNFVLDAYLGNYDVLGLVFDNVVRGEDRQLYRIDNGGSMIFRARGKDKESPPDRIDEFDTMRNPDKYPCGEVFRQLTEADLAIQAKRLVEDIDEQTLDRIVLESGLTGEPSRLVRNGLIGRRTYLIKRFGL